RATGKRIRTVTLGQRRAVEVQKQSMRLPGRIGVVDNPARKGRRSHVKGLATGCDLRGRQQKRKKHISPPILILAQLRRMRATTGARAPKRSNRMPANIEPFHVDAATPQPPPEPPPMLVCGAQSMGPPALMHWNPVGQGLAIMSQLRVQKCLLAPESKAQKPPGHSASL